MKVCTVAVPVGAHCLAHVRVAVLNEEFSVEKPAAVATTSAASNPPSAHRPAKIESRGLIHSHLRKPNSLMVVLLRFTNFR
jgi:hypothetical protein